jgi:hypothetical protein
VSRACPRPNLTPTFTPHPPPMTAATPTCQVVISQVDGTKSAPLGLQEVQLVGSDGAAIPASRLQYTLSSSLTRQGWAPSSCFDGVTDAMGCHTGRDADPFGDPAPSLTVVYPCAGGSSSALSRVVLFNYNDTCCLDRIRSFKLDFIASNGTVESTYDFGAAAAARARYEISPQGERRSQSAGWSVPVCFHSPDTAPLPVLHPPPHPHQGLWMRPPPAAPH